MVAVHTQELGIALVVCPTLVFGNDVVNLKVSHFKMCFASGTMPFLFAIQHVFVNRDAFRFIPHVRALWRVFSSDDLAE